MPMIGSNARETAAKLDPSALSGSDRLMLFGSALKDVGSSLRGGDAEAMANMQALLAQRQLIAQRSKLLGQAGDLMNGDVSIPQVVGAPRTSFVDGRLAPRDPPPPGAIAENYRGQEDDGLNLPSPVTSSGGVDMEALRQPAQRQPVGINDPRWGALAVAAKQYGLDLSDVWKLQEMRQPHVQVGPGGEAYNDKDPSVVGRVFRDPTNINGWVVDQNNPRNEGQYFGKLPDGMIPNGSGGVANASGLVPALQAQEEAQTLGRTRGSMLTVPRGDGSTQLMTGGQYLGGQGGPLVPQVGGQPGALGVSQTPGARAAAEAAGKTEGEAGAKARIDYPAVVQRNNQSLTLIDDLIQDPNLKDRLGWGSKLPVMPNSPGAGIEAKIAQLNGTVFLQAYQDLKGAGAITEVEGAKAEAAIARLQRRDQTYPDYLAALRDLREVISGGIGRAQQRAQFGSSGAPPSGGGQGGGSALSSIPLDARMQEARRRGLIK